MSRRKADGTPAAPRSSSSRRAARACAASAEAPRAPDATSYLADSLALECEAAWLEDLAALAARAVWHLHGWEEFDMLFGYERFDPFLSAGARGWMHDGQVGPSAGLGAFYYLTDDWALRFDAEATLGLDTRVETVYSISAGIQYFF